VPELPEVELVRQGLAATLVNQRVHAVLVRRHNLRYPIPENLPKLLSGQQLLAITRRGKYLLFTVSAGHLIWHLGMSGSLQILTEPLPPLARHDHIEITFSQNLYLRFNDPRRFGALLWTTTDPLQHRLLKHLGPEPLSDKCSATYLATIAGNKQLKVKNFIMDAKILVGVGNIYANEALFAAKIHPSTLVKHITFAQWQQLCQAIKTVLHQALNHGGTTLRDYRHSDGKPGYFKQKLQVYGRGGSFCYNCHTILLTIRLAQRATVYCPTCQQ
jgi:formamidopyrimidine-DNA glycosylase